ncbi:MAG: epoxide hydrolase 1 [Candidatus Eremiobacteraeota bacterium]|nr:epoxide hydrolase 1 [Candidatus Eremiobacteraeota bacterium]
MLTSADIRPFRIEVAQSELDDLRARLSHARLPDAIVRDWSDGTDTAYMRELLAYWRDAFDWRAQEARLNAFPHFKVRVAGRDVHVLHARGSGAARLPLILSHGWPGSFVEMLDIVPRLTHPERFGGDPRDAFDVVVPSLPGYGFSERPSVPGTTAGVIADLWAELMTTLGYERFGAQGGDWGSAISTHLGIEHARRIVGVHLNYMFRAFLPSRRSLGTNAHPDETAYFDDVARWYAAEGGYSHLQGTKPQTLAFALGDSPAGLAAYIVEKFRTWSDCGGSVESVFSKDTLLTNVAIYWFTATIGSSMHLYWERERASMRPPSVPPAVPFALAAFPRELSTPPRRLVERVFRVDRYTPMPRGGHFAALEQPEMLASDIAAFFRPLR